MYGSLIYALSFRSVKQVSPCTRQLNPVLTLLLWTIGKLHWYQLIYIPAQFLGAAIGTGLLYASMPHGDHSILTGYMRIDEVHVSIVQRFLMETFISFASFFVILVTAHVGVRRSTYLAPPQDVRNAEQTPQTTSELNALIIAGIVFVCAGVGGFVSGGFMNPVLAFSVSLISTVWYTHWIYWAGPLLGA